MSNPFLHVYDLDADGIVPVDKAKPLDNKDLHSRYYCDTCPRMLMDCRTSGICNVHHVFSTVVFTDLESSGVCFMWLFQMLS